jgi:hypothetical protein
LCINCNKTRLKKVGIVFTVREEAFIARMTRSMIKDVEKRKQEEENKEQEENKEDEEKRKRRRKKKEEEVEVLKQWRGWADRVSSTGWNGVGSVSCGVPSSLQGPSSRRWKQHLWDQYSTA